MDFVHVLYGDRDIGRKFYTVLSPTPFVTLRSR